MCQSISVTVRQPEPELKIGQNYLLGVDLEPSGVWGRFAFDKTTGIFQIGADETVIDAVTGVATRPAVCAG